MRQPLTPYALIPTPNLTYTLVPVNQLDMNIETQMCMHSGTNAHPDEQLIHSFKADNAFMSKKNTKMYSITNREMTGRESVICKFTCSDVQRLLLIDVTTPAFGHSSTNVEGSLLTRKSSRNKRISTLS